MQSPLRLYHTIAALQLHQNTAPGNKPQQPTLERAVTCHLGNPACIAGRYRRAPPEGVEWLARQVSGRQQRQLTGQHHARLQNGLRVQWLTINDSSCVAQSKPHGKA